MKIRKYQYYLRLKVIAFFFQLYCKIMKKRFFCKALNGRSGYNIAINSDMTVSCNCNDRWGFGKIGDLNRQGLGEIFKGKTADRFRKQLANGKLPLVNCINCCDLSMVTKRLAKEQISNFSAPKYILLENTVNCNLKCLSCNRENIYSVREKRSMSLEDLEKISRSIKENNVKMVFYFNLGEPFLSSRIKEELIILKKLNPRLTVITSTNGMHINAKKKQEAALMFDEIHFSIHGPDQKSAARYQRGINFSEAYKNMKNLVKLRDGLNKKLPRIRWKYVLFRWNDSENAIKKAIGLAKKANVDEILFENTDCPWMGPSYKHYWGIGYLNKLGKFNNRQLIIKLR